MCAKLEEVQIRFFAVVPANSFFLHVAVADTDDELTPQLR
jgi:hypothetical protein